MELVYTSQNFPEIHSKKSFFFLFIPPHPPEIQTFQSNTKFELKSRSSPTEANTQHLFPLV